MALFLTENTIFDTLLLTTLWTNDESLLQTFLGRKEDILRF